MSYKILIFVFSLSISFPLFSEAHEDNFGSNNSGKPIPNSYIVVLKQDVEDPREAAKQIAAKNGIILKQIYSFAIKGFSGVIAPAKMSKVEKDYRVDYVEPDITVSILNPPPHDHPTGGNGEDNGSDPAQVIPTGVNRVNGYLSSTANIDNVDDAIDVDIAIIDTGLDTKHKDLNVHKHVRCSGTGSNSDQHGHGSHVGGTAAAIDNNIGVVGVAPGARLWGVKVLDATGSGSLSCVIAGVDYVTQNADKIEVANMSLGGPFSSLAFDTAISNSVSAGVTYVVAAGNDLDFIDFYSPANHPDVITVAAITDTDGMSGGLGSPSSWTGFDSNGDFADDGQDDSFAWFSNFGGCFVKDVEVAAPGVDILSTWKDKGYNTVSGTSMSSPHVAGAAALIKANNPGFTPAQVLSEIQSNGITSGYDYFTDDPDDFYEFLLGIHSAFCGKYPPPYEPLLDVSSF